MHNIRIFCITAVFFFGFIQVNAQLQFEIPYPAEFGKAKLDGRLLLLISRDSTSEPRFGIGDGYKSQQVTGIDVENWIPGETKVVDANAFGYPVESLAQLPAGYYRVQVLLHKYETFKRKDGHTVKLPMDRGEGQHWNTAPGNLYSEPKWMGLDPKGKTKHVVALNKEIPPITPPEDTKYIKHIRIQSKLLTEFWGRPFYIGAHVRVFAKAGNSLFGRVGQSISALAAHRTVRESLPSYGSCYSVNI